MKTFVIRTFSCLVLAVVSVQAVAREALLTCPQISRLMSVVQVRHAAAHDPRLREKLLTEGDFARSLREGFADSLDPLKHFLFADEAEKTKDMAIDEIEHMVFERGDCQAFEAVHATYLAAVDRSLQSIPPLGQGEDPLRAPVMALLNGWQASKPSPSAALRDEAWAHTEAELLKRIQNDVALITFVSAHELSRGMSAAEAREEAYKMARAEFDRERTKPVDAAKLPEMMAEVILAHIDSHSAYKSEAELEMIASSMMGFVGIGAALMPGYQGPYIRTLLPGGSAQRSGLLKEWDKVIAVDNQATASMTLEEVTSRVRGPKNTSVSLTILRRPSTSPISVRIPREVVSQQTQSIEYSLVTTSPAPLGYVKLSIFGQGGARAVQSAIDKLVGQGARGLVLDLRGDPGGILTEAVDTIQLFEGKAPSNAVYLLGSEGPGVTRFPLRPENVKFDLPLVILVDRQSASASEIVSGVLQSYGRALVVGDSATFGKGSVQTMAPVMSFFGAGAFTSQVRRLLPPGGLILTIGYYFLPDGRSIQGAGIEPDIVLFPERAVGDYYSEVKISHYSLPQPEPLTSEMLPASDDVALFSDYRRQLTPLRERLKADFSAHRDELLKDKDDPERKAALFILNKWVGSAGM